VTAIVVKGDGPVQGVASPPRRILDTAVILCRPGEAIDAALTRLSRFVLNAHVLADLAARRRGVTPAGRRRLKARRALNRLRRNALRTAALDAEP